jgi:hypothetical protein
MCDHRVYRWKILIVICCRAADAESLMFLLCDLWLDGRVLEQFSKVGTHDREIDPGASLVLRSSFHCAIANELIMKISIPSQSQKSKKPFATKELFIGLGLGLGLNLGIYIYTYICQYLDQDDLCVP